jgi:hypothetical protein
MKPRISAIIWVLSEGLNTVVDGLSVASLRPLVGRAATGSSSQ